MTHRPGSTPILLAVLCACGIGTAAASPESLDTRCRAAIAHEDVAVPRVGLKQTLSVATSPHAHLFQYTAADGGIFSCQLCDDHNPAAACPSLGIDLSYRPSAGELRRLPAELDRKCLD